MNLQFEVAALSGADVLARTRALARQTCFVEGDLLVHLGEVDERQLFLECAFPSMFAFCITELRFSEDATYYRIHVARAARRLPAIIDAIRAGKLHLAGARILAPHLTPDNHVELLAEAAGKSKRQIEEIVARVAPQPDVPTSIRKMVEPCIPAMAPRELVASATATTPSPPAQPQASQPLGNPRPALSLKHGNAVRAAIRPLGEETFKVQFTATRAFRDKLDEAQGLLRHRVPGGDVARLLEMALDLLIVKVKKERFATGRRARASRATPSPDAVASSGTDVVVSSGTDVVASSGTDAVASSSTDAQSTPLEAAETTSSADVESPCSKSAMASSRHVPDAIKRAVYERDGGRCTFTDDGGRRCAETGGLEFDHVDGFAMTRLHDVDRIRLLCRAHNQHAADKMYGRAFMDQQRHASANGRRRSRDGHAPGRVDGGVDGAGEAPT